MIRFFLFGERRIRKGLEMYSTGCSMENRLRVLMLEDNPGDAELNEVHLQRAGISLQYRRVETQQDYLKKLEVFKPDIILADYRLPQFDGITALRLAQERYPFIPFIIVSGVLNEEAAVNLLRAGAADYVLKGNIVRLAPAVRAALEMKKAREDKARAEGALRDTNAQLERRVKERTAELVQLNARLQHDVEQRKRVEAALRESRNKLETVIQSMTDAVYITDTEGNFIDFNTAFATFHKFRSKDEVFHKLSEYQAHIEMYFPDGTLAQFDQWAASRALKGETVSYAEYKLRRKDTGETWWGSYSFAPLQDSDGRIEGAVVVGRDITGRKILEEKLRKSLDATINAIGRILEIRDPYTAGHEKRTSDFAIEIARAMGLPEEKIAGLKVASVLHDMGKIYVPAEILSKPGKLNSLEFRLIKTHPQAGADILKYIDFLWPVAEIIREHQERWNGSGYPDGLSGKDIMLEARILGIADVVESMATPRPYRPARGVQQALEEITRNRGVLYDPDVVDCAVYLLKEKKYHAEKVLQY
jgi:PAS domain S-box-containing protein